MATLTKVLTSDGLLYYTLLLRNKFNTKADKTEIPSTIVITPNSSNVSLALSDGTTTGTAVTFPAVDSTNAGLMTPTMLSKLNGIAAGAEVNVIETVSIQDEDSGGNTSTSLLTPTGTDIMIPLATTSLSGLISHSDKIKLNSIASGAEVNVQSDWNQTTTTADDYIKNKPTLATVATSGSYNDLLNKPSIPDDSDLVHKTGNEDINGDKNFNGDTKLHGTVTGELYFDNDLYFDSKITLKDDNSQGWVQIRRKSGIDSFETLQDALNAKQNVIDSSHKLSADLISDGTTNKAYTATEQTKLSGIESGAEVNVLESVKVPVPSPRLGGDPDLEALTISNRAVTLPIADSSTYGLMTPDMVTKLAGSIIKGIIYNGSDLLINASTNKVTIPLDDSPTNNSANLVKSGGVYSALALKAPLASPDLTGTPTAPTAASGTNSTQIATTAFVQAAISAAVTGSFKFVNSLPTTGEEGYIYLVPHTHSGSSTNSNPDVKDEYIWNTSASPAQWELIGNTDLDLSNYWNTTDLVALTTSEITTIWNTGMSND